MIIVLLSGGSGKRLWPLSNDVRSKQFLKLFKNADGEYESMVQRVYRQIKTVDNDAKVVVATSRQQVSAIHNQLGDKVSISIEPCRRDTFPAIVLAAAYIKDVLKVKGEESIVICPVDPYVENEYFVALKELSKQADFGRANLVLMGIEPTCPREKYGYIIPKNKNKLSQVAKFTEKPNEDTAKRYIEQGALWNGGVFALKIDYVLNIAKTVFGTSDYYELFNNYDKLQKISFDYAVVEKEPRIEVIRYNGKWNDLGTWNTLTEVMSESIVGNAQTDEKDQNVHIINELDIPIIALGMKNTVISASPDGILVSDLEKASNLKQYVDSIHGNIRFAEKSWGCFKVVDATEESLTIRVSIKAGDNMNYHAHERRDEVWVVLSGKGKTIVEGMEQIVETGDVITMQAGCAHTIIALSDLELVEVQLGKDISINDKQKIKIDM